MSDMFEQAVRMKLRWQYLGVLSVEDMWDVTLEGLDAIFKSLNAKSKAQGGESLLEETKEDEALALQISIVRHIAKTLLAEKEARENEVEQAARKQKLLAIIEEKQDEGLRDMSAKELQDLLDGL